jgi:hypothetical protein
MPIAWPLTNSQGYKFPDRQLALHCKADPGGLSLEGAECAVWRPPPAWRTALLPISSFLLFRQLALSHQPHSTRGRNGSDWKVRRVEDSDRSALSRRGCAIDMPTRFTGVIAERVCGAGSQRASSLLDGRRELGAGSFGSASSAGAVDIDPKLIPGGSGDSTVPRLKDVETRVYMWKK